MNYKKHYEKIELLERLVDNIKAQESRLTELKRMHKHDLWIWIKAKPKMNHDELICEKALAYWKRRYYKEYLNMFFMVANPIFKYDNNSWEKLANAFIQKLLNLKSLIKNHKKFKDNTLGKSNNNYKK